MDLSFLKWPLIILIIVGLGWLLTEGGVNYMYNKFTQASPGEDEAKDAFNEAGLYRLGGYLLMTFRYERAAQSYETEIRMFPEGENYWMANYNLARCYEKMEDFQKAVDLLAFLRNQNADQYDERVPDVNTLTHRIDTLVEVNELIRPPMY